MSAKTHYQLSTVSACMLAWMIEGALQCLVTDCTVNSIKSLRKLIPANQLSMIASSEKTRNLQSIDTVYLQLKPDLWYIRKLAKFHAE